MVSQYVRMKTMLIFRIISCVLGILFNSIVLLVRGFKFYKQRRISSYHFIILQITFADLIFASVISFDIEKQLNSFEWNHSLASCRLVTGISIMSGAVPILLMVLLAFERYQGIVNTLTYHLRTRSIALLGILMWLIAFGYSIPSLIHVNVLPGAGGKMFCHEYSSKDTDRAISLTYCVSFVLIPLLLTSIFHCRIFHFVRIHTKKMSMHVQRTCKETQSKNLKRAVVETQPLSSLPEEPNNNEDTPINNSPHILEDDGMEKKSSVFRTVLQRGSTLIQRHVTSRRRRRSNDTGRSRKKSRKLKVQILLAITLLSFICNAPLQLILLLNAFDVKGGIFDYLFLFVGLAQSHCFVNGIIYSLLDFKFRREFKNLLLSIYWKFFPRNHQQKGIPRNVSVMTSLFPTDSTSLR